MAEVILSVPFKYQPNPQIQSLLEAFREMLNFCIQAAISSRISSYARLRKTIYAKFRSRFPGYASHCCHSATRIALAIVKSWKRRCRKGLADPRSPPVARKLFARLDDHLARLRGDKLVISMLPGKPIQLELIYGDYQRKFLEGAARGEYKVGEISINSSFVIIPFRKSVDLTQPQHWIAFDLNERSVVGLSDGGQSVIYDLSKISAIHHHYSLKRRSVQEKIRSPRARARLWSKYASRERNRVRDKLHKLSRKMVDWAAQLGAGIILEDLRDIKFRISRSKFMRRRLQNSWNPRQLQFYMDYKARLAGIPVVYLNPRNTSRICSICGGIITERACPSCRMDRHVNACCNLLRMWGLPVHPESLAMKPEPGSFSAMVMYVR